MFEKINNKGFSLLELALALGLFMILAAGLVSTAVGGYLGSINNDRLIKANSSLIESWEAVKSIRNDSWSNITNGTHGLLVSGATWVFSGSSDTHDGITRSVTVSDVRRNLSGDIVVSGGTVDDDSKQITIDISWDLLSGSQRNIQVSTYLTNYANPGIWPPLL